MENKCFRFKNRSLSYDSKTKRVEVTTKNTSWRQSDSSNEKMLIEIMGESYELKFDEAVSIQDNYFEDGLGSGMKTLYAGFCVDGHLLDLTLQTKIWIDNACGDIHFEISPIRQGDFLVKKLFWPAPFEFNEQKSTHYTILPMMQGFLIPNNYEMAVDVPWDKVFYERAAYMPWWGQIKDSNGFIAIAQTPFDGCYDLNHPANGPTRISPYWASSLGKIAYARKLLFKFIDDCDYNDLCKAYRKYIDEKGELVTLKEKAARNSKIDELIGSAIVHTGGWYHAVEDSAMFDKENAAENDKLITALEVENGIDELSKRGVKKIYLHFDGWGKRGYDNLHPDVFPPSDEIGGFAGMRSLCDKCHENGYLFGIHDQYRDYYYDAQSFSMVHAVHEQSLKTPYCDAWHGGKHTYLCASLAPQYVKRNYRQFDENNINLDGSYLDVFSVVNLDECFHSEHPMTRKECAAYRAECLNYIRSRGMIVSSEEVVDWALPYLELCHHAPFRVTPENRPYAIPVPLFTLVYHDCIVVPWSHIKGDWYIPSTDHPSLYAMLYGGVSYLDLGCSEEQLRVNQMICMLHENIGRIELLKHEFLDEKRRIQKTYYANGTTVKVNFDSDEYEIVLNGEKICGRILE